MKKIFLLNFLILIFHTSSAQVKDTTTIFDDFNDFLLDEVVFGLVDYGGLKENPGRLNSLVNLIATYNPKDSTLDHRTAFYINAYNILVMKQVADNYPVNSPKDIDGFFKRNTFIIAGETLTLDQIEFEKLISPTKDPRIHFALGCGARSCPFLYDNAFYPERLEEQLAFRSSQIIERPSYVYVDAENDKVVLNMIFNWYGDQFSQNAGSLINYVNKYRENQIPKNYTVEFQQYDWSLNDR